MEKDAENISDQQLAAAESLTSVVSGGTAAGPDYSAKAAPHAGQAAEPSSVSFAAGTPLRKHGLSTRSILAPRSAVGLDIADDVVSVVKVQRKGRDFRVVRAGNATIQQPAPGAVPGARRAALAAAINQAMKNARIRTSKVVVNLPGDPAECSVRTLPPMSAVELETVIRREGVKLFGEETAWDYVLLTDRAGEEQRVLTAYAPGEKVNECLNVLRDCGLTALAVTTSHSALLELTERLVAPNENAALVHFGGQAVSVVILTDGSPVLIRRIQLDQGPDGTPEFVVQEINRTFMYFKQKCRGKRVTRVIQWGASEVVLELLARRPETTIDDFGSLPFGLADGHAEFSPVAVGLAVMGTTDPDVNLLPEEMKERRERGLKAVTMTAAAASATVIYIACYMALFVAEGMYRQALGDAQLQTECFKPVREEHRRIETLKDKLDHRRELFGTLVRRSLPWPHLLWALGKVTPPDADLNEVTATRSAVDGSTCWVLKLSGELGLDSDRREVVLRQFLDRLRHSGLFSAVQLEPLHESTLGGKLRFTIRCEVLPPEEWVP